MEPDIGIIVVIKYFLKYFVNNSNKVRSENNLYVSTFPLAIACENCDKCDLGPLHTMAFFIAVSNP